MTPSFRLLARRNFLPLFVTQFLNAFNDNLYKTAMVMLVTYEIYADPTREAVFNAVAGGVFILPFFLFSALSGQLADWRDKAAIIRIVKSAEIGIMVIGGIGLVLHSIPLMLLALFAMGVHSAFFGPIKYAILPQHLKEDEVLPGTGLVEATTYIAILIGTIVGGALQGLIHDGEIPRWTMAALVITLAIIGRGTGGMVPPAPPEVPNQTIDLHIIRSSIRLVRATMHIRHLYLAILSISFFWAMGAILAAQFPPLVKNVLGADETVATLMLAVFSVGVAIGSIIINRMLKGKVSARFSPISALVMGLFVLDLYWSVSRWPPATTENLLSVGEFVRIGLADRLVFDLFGVAVAGGMFVVPLYAFLTTTVPKDETARTVAANNIVNSGAMVLAAILLAILLYFGVSVAHTLLMVAMASVVAAALAWRLHKACD
jgi:MFS family permease